MPAERRVAAALTLPDAAVTFLDLVVNQAAWWWCVLMARQGQELAAVAGPLAYIAGRIALQPARVFATLRLAAAGAAYGAVFDQLLAWLGLIDFLPAGTHGAFMVAIWAMFAASLEISAAFLTRLAPWQRSLAGALAGPLAYLGGERLGVLVLAPGAIPGIALEWALALLILPALVRPWPEREVAR
jgi:hypothetical protein